MLDQYSVSNPFPGLRAFEEEEDILFFGREKQVDELVTKLRTSRLIAVIGSSGSGKSSLVKSGLIPSLQSGFMSGAGSNWRMCTFKPGTDPIGNMARAIIKPGVLGEEGEDDYLQETMEALTESTLRRSSNGLIEVFKQSGIPSHNNLLILVDQFEEIFRFSKLENDSKEGKRDSIAFINLLLKASQQTDYRIYIVFTMRSDFLSDCTEFRGLPEAINDGNYLVPRMTREERKDAIVGPISVAGAKVSQRLLNLLLNDVGDNPDQLPILQHALMRTFDFWKQKNQRELEIDFADYEGIGKMEEALSQHAEEAYADLASENERRICESIFKALTDKESDARGIRRPCKLSQLCQITNSSIEEVVRVIDVFRKPGRGFLMPPSDIPLNEETVIDISHESIMRVWDRLILWVDEESESSKIYIRLSEAAHLYSQGIGGLWRDPELQIAVKWNESHQPNSIWGSRYNDIFEKAIQYLDYCKQQFDLEIKTKEEKQRMKLIRLRRTLVGFTIFGICVFFLMIYAFSKKTEADSLTLVAENRTLEAKESQKIAVIASKKAQISAKEAFAEKQKAQENEKKAIEQKKLAEIAKNQAELSKKDAISQRDVAQQERKKADESAVKEKLAQQESKLSELSAKENARLAIEARDVSIRLKKLSDARIDANESYILFNEGRDLASKDLVLNAYKQNELNGGPLQNSDIYNALQINWEKQLNFKNKLDVHSTPVRSIINIPNTNLVFSGDENGRINLSEIKADGWHKINSFSLNEPIRVLKISPDKSKLICLTTKGNGYVFEIKGSEQKLNKLANFNFVGLSKSISFVDADHFLVLSTEGISYFSLNTSGNPIRVIKNNLITNLVLVPSGKAYTTTGKFINEFKNWEEIANKPMRSIQTGGSTDSGSLISSLDVDPTDTFVVAGLFDGQVFIKQLNISGVSTSPALHRSIINSVEICKLASGRMVAITASADQTIKIIDLVSILSKNKDKKEDVISIKSHTKWIYKVEFLSKLNWIISCGEDNKIVAQKITMEDLYQSLKN